MYVTLQCGTSNEKKKRGGGERKLASLRFKMIWLTCPSFLQLNLSRLQRVAMLNYQCNSFGMQRAKKSNINKKKWPTYILLLLLSNSNRRGNCIGRKEVTTQTNKEIRFVSRHNECGKEAGLFPGCNQQISFPRFEHVWRNFFGLFPIPVTAIHILRVLSKIERNKILRISNGRHKLAMNIT